jgi:hypothetical protein
LDHKILLFFLAKSKTAKVGTLILRSGEGKGPKGAAFERFCCDWGIPLFSFTYFHTVKIFKTLFCLR